MRGLLGILGAFMLAAIIGAGNRWSLINNLVSSFYKLTTDPHLDVKKNGFVAPLQITCMGLTLKLGLKLCNRYGPIKIIIISFLGMTACVFTASFMDEFACRYTLKIEFIVFNNVLYGIFSGMIFLTVLREPHKYFPKYKLISNSFVLMGAGLGSVMFGVMNSSCMNPLHEKTMDTGYYSGDKDYVSRNFPPCWRIMSMALLLIGSIGATLFYPLTRYNSKEEEIKLQKGEVPDF